MKSARTARAATYHHGALREAVLAEATRLVDESGPGALGLRELGRRLGVSHAAVHHHFHTLDDLARALSAAWFGDLDRVLERATTTDAPPLQRFEALGLAYVRYAIAHPHRYQLQFRGGPDGLVREADPSFFRVMTTVAACTAVAKRPIDPMVATLMAWSTMHGLAMLWIDGALRKRFDTGGVDALAAKIGAMASQILR